MTFVLVRRSVLGLATRNTKWRVFDFLVEEDCDNSKDGELHYAPASCGSCDVQVLVGISGVEDFTSAAL